MTDEIKKIVSSNKKANPFLASDKKQQEEAERKRRYFEQKYGKSLTGASTSSSGTSSREGGELSVSPLNTSAGLSPSATQSINSPRNASLVSAPPSNNPFRELDRKKKRKKIENVMNY